MAGEDPPCGGARIKTVLLWAAVTSLQLNHGFVAGEKFRVFIIAAVELADSAVLTNGLAHTTKLSNSN